MNPSQHFYKPNDPYDDSEYGGSHLKKLEDQSTGGSNPSAKKSLNSEGLYKSEGDASKANMSLYKPSGQGSYLKSVGHFLWGTRKRKLVTSGTGLGGGIVGVLLSILFIAAGPAQLIQLSDVLQNDFGGTNQSIAQRFSSDFTNSSGVSDSIGQTRLGLLAGRFLKPALTKLKKAGITFKTNNSGGANELDINEAAFKASHPSVADYTHEQLRDYLIDKFNADLPSGYSLDASTLHDVTDGFAIYASDFGKSYEFPTAVGGSLLKSSIATTSDGDILGAVDFRVLKRFFGLPDLFRPGTYIASALRKVIGSKLATKQDEADETNAEVIDGLNDATGLDTIRAVLQKALGGGIGKALATLAYTQAAICAVYNVAGTVVQYDHDAIVLPAALEAVHMISLGSEIEDGQNVTASQVGGAVDGLFQNGHSIWTAQSLQVTEQAQNPAGPDLPGEYAQAFSDKTTAANLQKGILDDYGDDICGTAGELVGLFISLAFLVASIPTGGSAEAWSAWIIDNTAATIVVGGTFLALEKTLENFLKDSAVVPAVLGGALGGNLLAYGAREAANIGARADGGVALSSSDATQEIASVQQQNQEQFRSQNLFARIFNIDDGSSLLGRLADYIQPSLDSIGQDILGLFDIGHIFSNLLGLITPHANADSSYNWGFPVYGIPSSLLNSNSPTLNNPYANANILANVLDDYNQPSSPNYNLANQLIAKAKTCFAEQITNASGVWDVVPIPYNDYPLDPNSSTYIQADCNDLSSPVDWNRMILFVFDTRILQSYACYAGDATSCNETGFTGS